MREQQQKLTIIYQRGSQNLWRNTIRRTCHCSHAGRLRRAASAEAVRKLYAQLRYGFRIDWLGTVIGSDSRASASEKNENADRLPEMGIKKRLPKKDAKKDL